MSIKFEDAVIKDLTGIGRYSFSRLSTYHTCQYQYNEHYNNRKNGVGNTFASYGTMAHAILEEFSRKELEKEDLAKEYKERFEKECGDGISMSIPKKDGGFFEKDLTDLYYNSGLAYFEDFNGWDDMEVLGIEEHFDILLKHNDVNFIFNGFIDLVTEKDNCLYVIDHKSKGKFKSKKEQAKYRRQLALYAIYAEHKWQKEVKEVWFNQFRINTTMKYELTDKIVKEALDWASDTVKDIESEVMWLPNTSDAFYCKNLCDLRNECPYSKQ